MTKITQYPIMLTRIHDYDEWYLVMIRELFHAEGCTIDHRKGRHSGRMILTVRSQSKDRAREAWEYACDYANEQLGEL